MAGAMKVSKSGQYGVAIRTDTWSEAAALMNIVARVAAMDQGHIDAVAARRIHDAFTRIVKGDSESVVFGIGD